jgi:hypothetical protein
VLEIYCGKLEVQAFQRGGKGTSLGCSGNLNNQNESNFLIFRFKLYNNIKIGITMAAFGEGMNITQLMALLTAIRAKDLCVQVKITDGPWHELSSESILEMIHTVNGGILTKTDDIRLRLFGKYD